jgi:hypothetical protein
MTTGRARNKHSYPELMAAADDERSRVRPRSDAPDGDERPAAPADAHRQRSSTPAPSLSERLEQKMLRATALLHAAVLRRDESLLDGVLSELAARPHKIG